ncbi:MAG TPA: transposase, partial [archaeon]|nr:transposase [archaeon]
MKLTYRYRSKNNKQIDKLTKISKDLYNQANYVVRQEFINNGKYLNYFEINKIMKTTTNKEGTINYRLLPAQTSQQILKQLDKNWVSFFRAIKDWKKNKSKYRGRPSLPKYIRKDKHLLIFPNQSIILKNNRLKNRKFGINIKLPQKD